MNIRSYRKIHRYLGLFVGVQLLLWTVGGLFFSLNSIEKVRGETEASEPPFLQLTSPPASPAPALGELAATQPGIEVRSVTLRPHLDDGVYEIAYDDGGRSRWALADTRTGRLRSPITEDEAVALGVITILSGFTLAALTSPRLRRLFDRQ